MQVVLLVRNATGDEEVGAAGKQLRGIILAHSLPHLSHLGALSFLLAAMLPIAMFDLAPFHLLPLSLPYKSFTTS